MPRKPKIEAVDANPERKCKDCRKPFKGPRYRIRCAGCRLTWQIIWDKNRPPIMAFKERV